MASSNSEHNQIDELLQSGQISNAVEFYNYFKNKSSGQSEHAPAPSMPTSSSLSSISSHCGKRGKKSKPNTLSDYASLLNVPVQSYPRPKFKKACSSNSLAVYANPGLSPAMSMSSLSSCHFTAYTPRRSTIYDEYIMDQQSNQSGPEFPSEPISSMFLKSATSYYQKYKQQQSIKSTNSYDDKEMDKRKEEAINRIIRNERIKEIRMKMYEYELLKEYQNLNVNQAASVESKSFDDFGSLNENVSEDGLDEPKQMSKANSYFSRTYGARSIYDEYKSNMQDNEDDGDDDGPNDDEDYESGIEDDELFSQKRKKINLYSGGFCFPPNQSRFQLKISIISAEVKNIINVLKQAELEVSALQRRVQLIEDDLEKTDERLTQATTKLNEASQAADESERVRKLMETRLNHDSDKVELLERQLREAKELAAESDRKYEEVSRKLVVLESSVERSEDRAGHSQHKIDKLEEELRLLNNVLKTYEHNEQKAIQREESYEEQIRDLSSRLKDAEQRADLGERTMAKLQKEVDRLEDELAEERNKTRGLQNEMEKCIADLQSM